MFSLLLPRKYRSRLLSSSAPPSLASLSKDGKDIKITRIQVYQVDLPLHEKSYKWSGGKSVDVFDATVVKVGYSWCVCVCVCVCV
jgi:hypothetical protein